MAQVQRQLSDELMELPASRLSGFYGISLFPGKGLGIRATREIPYNAEVMACAVKELSSQSGEIPFPFAQYLFVDPEVFSESDEGACRYRMVCGDMVFLNHSDWPNCGVSWLRNLDGILFSILTAKRRIRQEEELTIRYTDACDYRAHGYF